MARPHPTVTVRRTVALALGIGVCVFVLVGIVAALVVVPSLGGLRLSGGTDLGTNITERDIPYGEQMRYLNAFSPAPVPGSATDIRLRYQRFQDSFFEAAFTLPPADFAAYVRDLQPTADPAVFVGKQIGPYTGSVTVDAATGRVTLRHASA